MDTTIECCTNCKGSGCIDTRICFYCGGVGDVEWIDNLFSNSNIIEKIDKYINLRVKPKAETLFLNKRFYSDLENEIRDFVKNENKKINNGDFPKGYNNIEYCVNVIITVRTDKTIEDIKFNVR